MYTNETTMMNPAAATDPTLSFQLPDVSGDTCEFSREELAEDMDGITVYFTRAKIPGGGVTQFELPSDDDSTGTYLPKLVGVILHSHDQCALWDESSDDEDNKPLCSSVDGKVGIGTPGGMCATCAMNAYGSSTKGAGKACKNSRVLYLLRSGEYLPLQLNLPPTSIGAFKEFYRKAFAIRQRPTYASLVEISLKKESNGKEEYHNSASVVLNLNKIKSKSEDHEYGVQMLLKHCAIWRNHSVFLDIRQIPSFSCRKNDTILQSLLFFDKRFWKTVSKKMWAQTDLMLFAPTFVQGVSYLVLDSPTVGVRKKG